MFKKMFKDPRTTITAVVAALCVLIKVFFKIEVPEEIQAGFIAVVIFLTGLFAADSGKKEDPTKGSEGKY